MYRDYRTYRYGRKAKKLTLFGSLGVVAALSLSSAQAADADQKTIEFIPNANTTPYFLREYAGVKQQAKKYGYETKFQAPSDSNVSKQLSMFNTAISQNIDGIILVPYSPTAFSNPVKKAMQQGIPVISTDSTLDPMTAVSYVAVPMVKASSAIAKWAANYVDKKGEYAIINYDMSLTSARLRKQGFKQQMDKYPNMKFAGMQMSHSRPAKAKQQTTLMLERNPNINVVFGANDRSALGAAQAVKKLGLKDKVTVVGFDADLGEINFIKSGVIKAAVLQSPVTMGKKAVDLLHQIFTGKKDKNSFDKNISIPYHIVTYKNYDSKKGKAAIRQYIEGYGRNED